MAVAWTWRTQLCFHPPLLPQIRQCRSVAAIASPPSERAKLPKLDESRRLPSITPSSRKRNVDRGRTTSGWKKFDSNELGITNSMITEPPRLVLNALKKKGYEAYLVGGCVRDLILQRIPKDFDIITSAKLNEVQNAFRRCQIVGKKFPICHVHVNETVVEVSSFSTAVRKASGQFNHDFRKPPDCSERDYIRWRNCLQRDFTINGLMFDPFEKIVYDYVGGMKDIKKTKVRTVIPAHLSFVEDCVRILRAIRIAARVGFQFTREIALYLKEFSRSVLKLDKGRILLELNYMFAYGSAEASLRLLWRFGLLEILLPIQASYFVSQGFRRQEERSNMLLSLFSNLDKIVAPDRPCHTSLWISIFAFHKALVDKPQDPSVLAAFSLSVHSGGSLLESVEIARKISIPHEERFHELSQTQNLEPSDALMDQVINFAASVKAALFKLTDGYVVSQAMVKYPQAPHSDLVFIPAAMSSRVCKIFECVERGKETGFVPKRRRKINSESLRSGYLQEIRHTFARIIFDTVYPGSQSSWNDFVSETQD